MPLTRQLPEETGRNNGNQRMAIRGAGACVAERESVVGGVTTARGTGTGWRVHGNRAAPRGNPLR